MEANRNIKMFIDFIHQVSGKWTIWDPSIPIKVGDYGTLNDNRELSVQGNIYDDFFQEYLDNDKIDLDIKAHQPELGGAQEDYIVASVGVKKGDFVMDQRIYVPMSASMKASWKFQDGKHGALVILYAPRQYQIPRLVLSKILKVKWLQDKQIVTSALACPAYLMYLSDKAGETLSVAFCARTAGDVANSKIGVGWWTNKETVLLRRACDPEGEYRFTPLFSLQQKVEPSSNRIIRKFIDLVRRVSGKWTNWDPSIPIRPGDYGTLNDNGELDVEGSIYDAEFQKYLDNNGIDLNLKAHQLELGGLEQDFIVTSTGVKRMEFNIDQHVNIPTVVLSSVKGTWKFQDGKRGVLVILHAARQIFISRPVLEKVLEVKRLEGKQIVTSAFACPAYLMYLSNKAGETFSAALRVRTVGDVANGEAGSGWWTNDEAALLRKAFNPKGEYCFTPLFSLQQRAKPFWHLFGSGGETGSKEYAWQDVYPTWKPLDEEGEEFDD